MSTLNANNFFDQCLWRL